jgi:sugar phosphate isomerase/epimerase
MIDRRDLMKAALLAPQARKAAAAGGSIQLGLVTNGFRQFSNRELAAEFAAQRIRLVQLFFVQTDSNYWRYGGRSDLPGMTPQRAAEIAGIYKSAGIGIHSLGVYTTLVHPDPTERKANLEYFERMMKIGGHMGVRSFLTEPGHYLPEGKHSATPFDYQDEVWKTTIATVKELARIAEAHDATVLLEPFYISVVCSAKRARMFLEEVGSPRVRVNLDPANLIEVNDLEEMFQQLGKWTSAIHAKDRKMHITQGVPAGQGDIDYPKLVTLAATRTPGAPLFIEYVTADDYKQALAHLRSVMKTSGIAES